MRGSTFSEKNCTRKNVKVEKRRTFCGSSFWSALFRRYIKCSGAIGDEVKGEVSGVVSRLFGTN